MTPKRIQLRRSKGWRLPEGAIVVTRSTPWGNPFSAAAGDQDVVEMYRQWLGLSPWLRDQITTGSRTFDRWWVRMHLHELVGHDLACFCDPLAACHADVLLESAKRSAEGAQDFPGGIMTDTPTPAELLTAAADRLEGLLTGGTPGPWWYNPEKAWHLPDDFPTRRNGEEFVGASQPSGITVCVAATGPADHPQSMADARFIAAMNPTVGRALVVAIRSWATAAVDEAAHGTNVAVVFAEELDLARAILGETS